MSGSRGALHNVGAYDLFKSILHSKPERHLNQALPIFLFLAPRMVPGPGWCYISAPCLQSGLILAISFILFAQRALFQPEEKKKGASSQAWCPWGTAGPGSPRRPRARKACELWGLALLGRGLGDHPPSSGGLLGSHLEASWGRCPTEGHSICCLSGDARWWGFSWAPSRSMSPLTHSEASKCKGKMIMVL